MNLSENVQLCCRADTDIRFPSFFYNCLKEIENTLVYTTLLFSPTILLLQVLSQVSGQMSRPLLYQKQIPWMTTYPSHSWFILMLGYLDTIPRWPHHDCPIISSTIVKHDSSQILFLSSPYNPTNFSVNFHFISILYLP